MWQRSPARRRILCSAVEHHAVLDTVEWLERHEGAEVTWLPVDSEGVVDLAALEAELSRDPGSVALVTVMWANNEVGAIQPVRRIVELAHAAGVPVHSDAVQAFGSLPVDFKESGLDAMSISGHKIGGPVGVGALLLGRSVKLTPVQHGGGPGTRRPFRDAGYGVHSSLRRRGGSRHRCTPCRSGADCFAPRSPGGRRPRTRSRGGAPWGTGDRRLPGNAHFTFPGCEGDSLLFLLDLAGIESSTGSACTAGVPRPSHVLLAMGLDEETARGAQRFSLGHTSTEADVDALLAALPEAYSRARQAGMAGHESTIQTAGTVARQALHGS